MPTITLTATPAFAVSFAGAGAVVGGASSNGADPLKPNRIKVPGYERGSMQGLTPVLAKEFGKLERAQPNSDTVEINADYTLGPFDRTIDVDTGRGDVTIRLKPASTRYAQSITIVKTSTDFNNVRVLAADGNQLGDAAGLSWTDPFVAYTMRPDGDTHWWIEGVHDEAVKIQPGQYAKVLVDAKGRVRFGLSTLSEQDVSLSDTVINDVTTDHHGLTPKLPGVSGTYLDGAAAAWLTLPAMSVDIDRLSNAISAEAASRVSADNVLSNQASVLSQAVSLVSQAISAVSTAASNALSAAHAAGALASVAMVSIAATSNALSVETAARVSADAGLSNRISAVCALVSVVGAFGQIDGGVPDSLYGGTSPVDGGGP